MHTKHSTPDKNRASLAHMAHDAHKKDDGAKLQTLTLRVPAAHRTLAERYAERLTAKGARVTRSAAGAAIFAAGLEALGLMKKGASK